MTSAAESFATLATRAAKAGFALAQIDGRYFAARWAHEREFESLEDLAQWLDRVTGSPARSGDAVRAYERAKTALLLQNPAATADEIEDAAKRAARQLGL